MTALTHKDGTAAAILASNAKKNAETTITKVQHVIEKNYAHISDGVIDNATIGYEHVNNLDANYAHLSDGVIDNATISYANVDDLESNYAHIADGVIDNATIGYADVNDLDANYAHITDGEIDNATIDQANVNDLTAYYAHITSGVIDNATIDYADVNNLNSNYAHITNGEIDNATISYANVDNLSNHYAEIDIANVNNAWIENGVIKDAAITDEKVLSMSANKLTAGTIDAGKINVANLNAKNLIVEKINGQPVLGGYELVSKNSSGYAQKNPSQEGWYEYVNGAFVLSSDTSVNSSKVYYKVGGQVSLYDQNYIDGVEHELNERIDGAVQTYTGSDIPTLLNYPAVDWTTAQKATHVGDIYYVINAASQADGYCYRFAYDNSTSTYSWVLIKDSDVTAALQRIIDAEGDISNLETFQSETTAWITETDEELSSIKGNVTGLTTRMGDAEDAIETKVDTTTFNTLSQTVGENSASITSLSNTVATKADSSTVTTLSNTVNSVSQTASSNSSKISNLTQTLATNSDGTAKTGDIVHRMSATEQDLSGFKTTVSSTYQTKDAMSSYSTTSQMNSAIQQSADSITQSVSETYTTKADFNTRMTSAESSISTQAGQIALKANSSDVYTKTEADGLLGDKADASNVYTKTQADAIVDGINGSISLKADSSSVYTKTQTDGLLNDKADSSSVYTKSEIDVTVSGINSTVSSKVGSSEVISKINQSPESITINAGKVDIEGATIFNNSGRLSQSSLNAAYDANGAASAAETAAKSYADTEIAKKKSIHTLTSGNTSGATYATILGYAAEGTTVTFSVTSSSGVVVGDTVRLAYKANDMGTNGTIVYIIGTVTEIPSSTSVKMVGHGLDTTVIDGGHIMTGTIDANKVNIQNLTVGTAQSGWNDLMNSEVINIKSATGSIVNIPNGNDYPLRKAEVTLEPQQDLHGYDKPWSGGNGKNKLNYDLWATNIHSGTPSNAISGTGVFENNGVTLTATANDCYTPFGGNTFDNIRVPVSEGETITLSWETSDNVNGLCYIFGNGATSSMKYEDNLHHKSVVYTVPNGVTFVTFRMGVAISGNTIHYKNIMIRKDGDATWKPYSNICPITGASDVEIYADGKYGGEIEWNQLAKELSADNWNTEGGVTATYSDGVATVSSATANNGIRTNTTVPVHNGHKYLAKFGVNGTAGNVVRMVVSSSQLILDYTIQQSNVWETAKAIFSNTSDVTTLLYMYCRNVTYTNLKLTKPQIFDLTAMFGAGNEPATVAEFEALFPKDYYVYNAGEKTCVSAVNGDPYEHTTISLGTTVYGGSVDVVAGTGTEEYGVLVFDGTQNLATSGSAFRYYDTGIADGDFTSDPNVISSWLENKPNSAGVPSFGQSGSANNHNIYFYNATSISGVTDLASFKTYLSNNPLTVVYKKATPTTLTLTPTQVDLISGTNYVFSPQGEITLEYVNASSDIAEVLTDTRNNADKYITYIDPTNGIKVHNANDSSNYAQINSNGMEVYQNNTKVADFGSTVTVGSTGGGNLVLQSNSVKMKMATTILTELTSSGLNVYEPSDSTNPVAQFLNTGAIIGKSNEPHMEMSSSTGIKFYGDLGYHCGYINGSETKLQIHSRKNAYLEFGSVDISVKDDSRPGGYGIFRAESIGTEDFISAGGNLIAQGRATLGALDNGIFTIQSHSKSSVSVSASSYATGTISATKSGYYPLGIVGVQSSSSYTASAAFYLTNISDGSCTINYQLANTSGSSRTTNLTYYVLWLKTTA